MARDYGDQTENRAAGGPWALSYGEKAQQGEMLWKAHCIKVRGWMKMYPASPSREGTSILPHLPPFGGQKVKVWRSGGLR